MGLREEFFEKYGDREVYETYKREKDIMGSKDKEKKYKEDKKYKKDKKDKHKDKKDKHKDKKDKDKKHKKDKHKDKKDDYKKKKQQDFCDIDPKEIKAAMCKGARTRQDLVDMLGICNECSTCNDKVDELLNMACKCKNVTMQDIRMEMRSGADTVEKLMERTGAGTKCRKCIGLLENMIELGY